MNLDLTAGRKFGPSTLLRWSSRGNAIRSLDTIAAIAIALQFAVLLTLSAINYNRYQLTGDFSGYYHAFSAIGRGILDPQHQDSTFTFIHNHGEVMMYLFAPFYQLFPSAYMLKFFQDASAVGCSVVGWIWIRDVLRREEHRLPIFFAGIVGLAIIVLDPWTYWSNAFDFHFQATAAFFMLLAAFFFYKRRFVAGFVAVIFVVFSGDVTSTQLVGLALSMFLIPGVRVAGAGVFVIGIAGFFAIHAFGSGQGYGGLESIYGELLSGSGASHISLTGFLSFLITHPGRVFSILWANNLEIYANVMPQGLIGVFHPWAWGVSLVTLMESMLADPGLPFVEPSFQNFAVYAFIPVGSALFFIAIAKRLHRIPVYIVGGLLLINAVGWSATWLGHYPKRWLIVSPAAAAEVHRLDNIIPRDEEVVPSEALVGRFGDRPDYYSGVVREFRLDTYPVNFIFAPYEGVNFHTVNFDIAEIAYLAHDPHAVLQSHKDGVWWFTYEPDLRNQKSIELPGSTPRIPAWALDGVSGNATMNGPIDTWRMEYDRQRGLLIHGAYWRVARGAYRAEIDMQSTGPTVFEVRNASSNTLVSRKTLLPLAKRQTITLDFDHERIVYDVPYGGWGPFQYRPLAFQYNALEVSLFSPGTGHVTVWNVGLAPLPDRNKPAAR